MQFSGFRQIRFLGSDFEAKSFHYNFCKMIDDVFSKVYFGYLNHEQFAKQLLVQQKVDMIFKHYFKK